MDEGATFEAIRNEIGERVRDLGSELRRAKPRTIGVVLAGAALWPIVAPLLGTGAAVTAVGVGLSLLEEPGRTFVSDFVKRLVDRGDGPQEARMALEAQLAERLAVDDAAGAALRADIGHLLDEAGGVRSALDAAAADVKDSLAQGLAELSAEWKEFGWMLGEVQVRLQDIQRRQSEGLAMQRATLDLQREQLVKTTLLLQRQAPPAGERPTEPAEAGEGPAAPADGVCPYKGLLSFQPEDADVFFGREALLADVIARLSEARFVAVVGASGSGKSSFVRAGLLTAIWKGALPASPEARVLVMTPGEHPLEQLALRIGLERGVAAGSILDDLRRDPARLTLAARQMLLDARPDARLVLLVDQFEELFTLCHDADERQAFVDALLAVLGDGDCPVVLVLAVRADFYGRFTAFPALARAVQDHQALVGRMSRDDLRRAIELPAAAAGLTLEPGLADAMLDDLGDEPGALPLLSHALLETWRRRRGSTMTLAGYHEAGGVGGAIAQTAESVVGGLDPGEQALARRVFLGLTEVGEGAEPTRRRVATEELVAGTVAASLGKVLDVLATGRLVTLDEDTVEVSHEALIRHWPTLRRWLEEDRESLRVQRRVAQASHEWEQLGRDPGALFRGTRLAGASDWAQEHDDELSDQTRRFLEASRAAEVAELDAARRRARRLKLVATALGVLGMAAATSAFIAIGESSKARSQQRLALSRGLTTQSASVLRQDPGRAALLGLESYRLKATDEARDAVLSALPRLGDANDTLTGRKGGEQELAFSPDGTRIATAAGDGVQLWDVVTRAPLGAVLPATEVSSVSFSPDGRRLAVADASSGVRVWDLRTRKVIGRPVRRLFDSYSARVAFSPDGKLLTIIGAGASQVLVWDLAAERRDGAPIVHGQGATSVQFSRDSTTIVTAGGDDKVRFWSAESHDPVRDPLPAGRHAEAVLSPDGTTIAINDGAHVRIRRLADGRQIGPALGRFDSSISGGAPLVSGPRGAQFSPDGKTVGYVDGDGTIRMWSVHGLHHVGPPLNKRGVPGVAVAFSADGTTVATADDQAVRMWNIAPPPPLTRSLVVGREYSSETTSIAITRLAFARRPRLLAAASDDNTVRLWDMAHGRAAPRLQGPPPRGMVPGHRYGFNDVQFAPGGRTLAAGAFDGVTRLWDIAVDPLRATFDGRVGRPARDHGEESPVLAFSADGATLAIGREAGISLLNVTTRRPISRPIARGTRANPALFERIAFSADNLLGVAREKRIDLYAVPSGDAVGDPLRNSAEVTDFAFNARGTLLASAAYADKAVIVWDVASRTPAGARLVHPQAINSVAFGRGVLAAGSEDGSAHVWSLSSRKLIGVPHDTGAPVTSTGFDPVSGALATGSRDGAVKLWDPLLWSDDMNALRRRICATISRNLSHAEWTRLVPGEPYHETCPG